MAPNRIILDSNVYFRLADNLHPLLAETFGKAPGYKLMILGGTQFEARNAPRLRSKFDWFEKEKHKEDRAGSILRLSSDQKRTIRNTRDFMEDACRGLELGCSSFDIECLAASFELKLPLVTDDLDLIALALEYDHPVMSTLELMRLMLNEGRVTMDEIRGTTIMWEYLNDTPSNFVAEYERLFGESPDRVR